MAAFIAALEKYLTGLALENAPLALLLFVAVIALAVTVTVRYNKKIGQALAERHEIEILKKQQGKIIQLLEAAPCISKKNATWLTDERQNEQPPEGIKCQYHAAKERGEK